MADEKKEGYSFWILSLSSFLGTTGALLLSHYINKKTLDWNVYADKAIKFLEDYKRKSQRGYDSDQKDI